MIMFGLIGVIKKVAKPVARIAGMGVGGGVVGFAADGGVQTEDPILTAVLAIATAVYQLVRELRRAQREDAH
jgi:hypothetical protein